MKKMKEKASPQEVDENRLAREGAGASVLNEMDELLIKELKEAADSDGKIECTQIVFQEGKGRL